MAKRYAKLQTYQQGQLSITGEIIKTGIRCQNEKCGNSAVQAVATLGGVRKWYVCPFCKTMWLE